MEVPKIAVISGTPTLQTNNIHTSEWHLSKTIFILDYGCVHKNLSIGFLRTPTDPAMSVLFGIRNRESYFRRSWHWLSVTLPTVPITSSELCNFLVWRSAHAIQWWVQCLSWKNSHDFNNRTTSCTNFGKKHSNFEVSI